MQWSLIELDRSPLMVCLYREDEGRDEETCRWEDGEMSSKLKLVQTRAGRKETEADNRPSWTNQEGAESNWIKWVRHFCHFGLIVRLGNTVKQPAASHVTRDQILKRNIPTSHYVS
jgi:hypothetical protein